MLFGVAIIFGVIFLIFFAIFFKRQSSGNARMREIQDRIKKGSSVFMKQEYKYIAIVVLLIAAVILAVSNFDYKLALFFFLGSLFSSFAGFISMKLAVLANARTAEATRKGVERGMKIAFLSGLCASIFTVLLGLIGIYFLYRLFNDIQLLYSFGFGATLIALFMRVGGGIFTKSADVSADLVGKVEENMPEDDERNPAVIADLVGDNVGDVAGMGSDLFESYVESIIAAMVLAFAISSDVSLPLKIASAGIIASIIGSLMVKGKNVYRAMLASLGLSTIILLVMVFFISGKNFLPILFGLLAGFAVGLNTVYYTSGNRKPSIKIAEAAQRGAALNVLKGISNGMFSALIPVMIIAIVMIASYSVSGLYGIALAAVGMLSIVATTLASTIYGSITDNAAGISEIVKEKSLRKKTERLDEVGNTTAAIGKGFAISSAALTSLALLASYVALTKTNIVDILRVENMAVLFIGVAIPFMFSSITMNAVIGNAERLVEEVRRQLRNRVIRSGKKGPDYERCVRMTTRDSIRKMVFPCFIVIIFTISIGFSFGKTALAGLIVGSVVSSFMLAIFMANSGASLDNAKKYIESGRFGGKESRTHKAAVIGDTVGDVFKDTAGPSLNILIKLIAITSLLFAILF